MKNLIWFRADLRTRDNKALAASIRYADEVIAVFIITPKTWQRHDMAAIKIQFILENLRALSDTLARQGIPLLVRETDYFSQCPQLLATMCQQLRIDAVYFNDQYEVDEQGRDAKVCALLQAQRIAVYRYHDQLILAPGSILSQQKKPFTIFTPFKKAWLSQAEQAWQPITTPAKKLTSLLQPETIPTEVIGFAHQRDKHQLPAGEHEADKKLSQFCQTKLLSYHAQRDFPSLDGTSQLSPYLAQGIISPRQCVKAMIDQLGDFKHIQQHIGAATWLSELIWREFYKHILCAFPAVSCHEPFNSKTKRLAWRSSEDDFQAWCTGKTGFPLVDAAMRQLYQHGWMHNRLRMVTAMFFTKILLLDWRQGERYFMQTLIDGDLSANNGGWQWSASTGTDAVPYFRIFNPTTQSERFDADGAFIRHYCPELAHLDHQTIHNPYSHGIKPGGLAYPQPIANYVERRKQAIQLFKGLS